jgi:predicted DNA-binding protein (MmcQ/YjbR family)
MNNTDSMNIEDMREYCISKTAVTEGLPFGDDTLVFKVAGKMFLLANLDGPLRINIKAAPEEVIDRIDRYPEALPGYHMNKKHWITVDMDTASDYNRIKQWIDESYQLVLSTIPKKQREEYDC